MDTKDLINDLIDNIIDGKNAEAQEVFDNAIASKVVDTLDARKIALAQTIYSREEEQVDGSEEEQSDASV